MLNAIDELRLHIGELNRQARAYMFRGDPSSAYRCYVDALTKARFAGESALETYLLANMVTTCAEMGDATRMSGYLQELERIAQQTGNKEALSECLEATWLRGWDFVLEGQYSEALRCFQTLAKGGDELGNARISAQGRRGEGNVYIETGHCAEAVPVLDEALHVAEQAGLLNLQCSSLNDLADARIGLGDIPGSISLHQRALKIASDIGDQRREGLSLGGLGRCYRHLNKVPEAISYFESALKLAQQIGDSINEVNWLAQLGGCFGGTNQAREVECLERALTLARRWRFSEREAEVLASLGNMYSRQGEPTKGIGYLEQAIRLVEVTENYGARGRFSEYLGVCYFKLGNHEREAECYETALGILRKLGDKFSVAACLAHLGGVRLLQNKDEESLRCFAEGLHIFGDMRAGMWIGHDSSFLRLYSRFFDNVVPLSVKTGRLREGLEFCEAAKSAALSRRMVRGGLVPQGVTANNKVSEWNTVRSSLQQLEVQIERCESVADWSNLFRLRSSQIELMQRFAELLKDEGRDQAKTGAEWAFAQRGAPTFILESGHAVVEFFATEADLILFLIIGSGDVHVTFVPELGRKAIDAISRSWASGRDRTEGTCQEALGKIGVALDHLFHTSGLYQRLPIQRLTIIPHHALHLFPIHIAKIGADYLCDLCEEINYAPNLSVLTSCKQSEPRRLAKLLMITDPSLQFAEAEKRGIVDCGMFDRIQKLEGESANPAQILSQGRDADVLHFICHGKFDPNDPMKSYLLPTGRDEPSSNQQERLTVANVLANSENMHALVAFLSACETGMVKPDPIDEYVGLPHAFLASGAATVISSLWQVDDLSTSYMVRCFYSFLKDQMTQMPAESRRLRLALALKKAQESVRYVTRNEIVEQADSAGLKRSRTIQRIRNLPANAKPFSEPWYWAPFVCIGAPEVLITA
jgi:CHAT domain-containing protein/tetratricopeptide (TPR) repeat protein